jgi:hypothetical protein
MAHRRNSNKVQNNFGKNKNTYYVTRAELQFKSLENKMYEKVFNSTLALIGR